MRHGGPLLRSTIRPAFASQPDPLPFSTEDMIEEELDADRPKKKAKFGRKSGDWVFKQESPSPEMKPEKHEVTGIFDDVEMIENELEAEKEMEQKRTYDEGHTEPAPGTTELDMLDALQDETEVEQATEEYSKSKAIKMMGVGLRDKLQLLSASRQEEATQPSSSSQPRSTAPSQKLSPMTDLAANGFALTMVEALAKEKQSAANPLTTERAAIPESIDQHQAPQPDPVSADVIDATDALAAMGAEDLDKLDQAKAVHADEDFDQTMTTGEEHPEPGQESQSQRSQSRQSSPRHQGQEVVGGGLRHRGRSATPPRMSPRAATAMDALALIVLGSLKKSGKRFNRAGEIEDIKDEDEDMESGDNQQPDFGYDGAATSKPFVQHQKFLQLAEAVVPDMIEQDVPDNTNTEDGGRNAKEQERKSTISNVRDGDDDDRQFEQDNVQEDEKPVVHSENNMADEVREDDEDEGSSKDDTVAKNDRHDLLASHQPHVAHEEAIVSEEAEENANTENRQVYDINSSESEDEIHAQPTVEHESALKHVASDEASISEPAEEDVDMERQDVLVDDSSESEDEIHAQPTEEDESALKHVASAQTNTSQEEDVQREEKHETETAKPALRERERTKKLMTFEEATAASQPLETSGTTAAQETHISRDKITIEEEEEPENEEDDGVSRAEIPAAEQVDDMSSEVSVQQAEQTADYLLEVLADSSNAIMSEANVEQTTTPEPATRTSLRGVTLSPTLATEHWLEIPATLPHHVSLPEASLTSRETRASKAAMFKPRLPRQASNNSGNLSIINKLEDEYLSDQLLAQPQPQLEAATKPRVVTEPRAVTEPGAVTEPRVVTNEPDIDHPLPVQTPWTSRKTRSTTKPAGRKSAVPNELRGWFSPRVENGEMSAPHQEAANVDSVTQNNDLNGILRSEGDQQIEVVASIAAHGFNQVLYDSGKVQETRVEELSPVSTKAQSRNTKQARKSVSEEPHPKTSHEGLQTALSYYTPLSNLHLHLNRVSSQSEPNTVDVLAIVSSAASMPSRATSGPRDHFTTLKITTPPAHGKVHVAFPQTQVQIFRPAKDVLPVANVGDVVLLRDFVVRSAKGKCFLLSTASSAWCVWRYGKGSHVSVECLGRPVEFGNGEENHARALRKLWVLGGKEDNEVEDVEREEAVNGHMG